MKTYLEIFTASFEDDCVVRYAKAILDISDDIRNPDEIVQEAVNNPSKCMPQVSCSTYISHSTSWRYESDGSIYLTYLVFSDQADFSRVLSETLQMHDMHISPSVAADKPRPKEIREEHVISHGMRHLSHLVNDSGQNIYRSALSNKSLSLFARIGALLAGKI
jgi:hypothetical protein